MSKRKRPAPQGATANIPHARRAVPLSPASEPGPLPVYDPDSKFSVREYVILNVIFDAFCLFNLALVFHFLKETRGLLFFFGLLMLGFLAVSVYDYAFDRLAVPPNEPPAN